MLKKTKIQCIPLLLVLISVPVFSQDKTISELISSKSGDIESKNSVKALPGDTVRMRIIEKARKYIGVKYKWGESGENGFDCSGYVKFVYDQFGYKLPHSSYDQYNNSRRLTEKKARPGDLVFFVTRGERISHVGIYIGNRSFIHAPGTGKYVRVESLDTGFYRKTLAGFGTLL